MSQNKCWRSWFAHHEDRADLCATDVKEIPHNTVQWNLFCPTTRARSIRYQYSYMIVERRTIPLWPNNDWQTELVSNELSCADWTECIERYLKALLLEAMDFVHTEDNDDLSSTHVTSKTGSVKPGEQMYLLLNIFHVTGERTTISLWHNKGRWAELISKRSTKYKNTLKAHFQIFFNGLYNVKTENLIYRN